MRFSWYCGMQTWRWLFDEPDECCAEGVVEVDDEDVLSTSGPDQVECPECGRMLEESSHYEPLDGEVERVLSLTSDPWVEYFFECCGWIERRGSWWAWVDDGAAVVAVSDVYDTTVPSSWAILGRVDAPSLDDAVDEVERRVAGWPWGPVRVVSARRLAAGWAAT